MTSIDHSEDFSRIVAVVGVGQSLSNGRRAPDDVIAAVFQAAPQLTHPLFLEGRDEDMWLPVAGVSCRLTMAE